MKKITLLLFSLIAGAMVFQACEDNDDQVVPVNDFIWKGLNLYYLWQENVPNLADDRFANQKELNYFLQSYSTPEALFESLLYRQDAAGNKIDRFSVIVSDFTVLENVLQGTAESTGAEFGLLYTDNTQTSVFGYVRYILPNSNASAQNIRRGDIFYAVNGTPLTASNYSSLLNQESYTLNMATYDGTTITPNNVDVTLTKAPYTDNPVYIANTYTQGAHKIGYLMYNGFYANFDNALNDAFGQFKTDGVTDLVLDLRYNGGGSVRTATYLASMITGQFNGQPFAKEQWNSKLEAYYESNNPGELINLFTDKLSDNTAINSLNLTKVYIIGTGSTASASELVINCLKPYVQVVQIGAKTVGKNAASVTLYDSPDFTKNHLNGSHRYAMQPLVLKLTNKDGFGDYTEGLVPTISLPEDYSNLGVLGDPTERLYAAAISQITANGKFPQQPQRELKEFKGSREMRRFGTEMYIDQMPAGSTGLIKTLQP